MVAASGSPILLFIIIAFFVLWLVVIRPQKKRQSQARAMREELHVGDEVLTAGGIYATITELEEDHVTVEIAPNTVVQLDRRAIASVLTEPEPEESDEAEESDEPEGSDAAPEPDEAENSSEQEGDPTEPIPGGEPSNEENRG